MVLSVVVGLVIIAVVEGVPDLGVIVLWLLIQRRPCGQTWSAGASGHNTWKVIREWLLWCYANHCFCPADRERSLDYVYNVAAYVSSPGSASGGLPDVDSGVFRVAPDRLSKPVHWLVASRVAKVYGKDLFHFCHMGKEESVYAHALYSCMTHFRADFRLLFDNCPLYDTGFHLRKLGLEDHFPGLCAGAQGGEPSPECDPYVRAFSWKGSGGAPVSEGLGINIWGALVMASLIESSDLHPKGSSDFARNVLSQVLLHAPVCATPGNIIPIRGFNVHSGKPLYMMVPTSSMRPEHFLRPVTDENFGQTGELTYCRERLGLLPEDMMHCGNLLGMASFLKCGYLEVPASVIRCSYHLVPRRRYPVWRPSSEGASEMFGDIYVENSNVHLRCFRKFNEDATPADQATIRLGPMEWEVKLREQSLIILPMICRPCAAAWMGDDGTTIGLISPAVAPVAGDSLCVNFDHIHWRYTVICSGSTDVRASTPLDTLKSLIPIGTSLWVVPGSETWVSLEHKMSPNIPARDKSRYAIRVRLNVPPSANADKLKLYVSYLECHRSGVGSKIPRTISVNPWELVPEGSQGLQCVSVLLMV